MTTRLTEGSGPSTRVSVRLPDTLRVRVAAIQAQLRTPMTEPSAGDILRAAAEEGIGALEDRIGREVAEMRSAPVSVIAPPPGETNGHTAATAERAPSKPSSKVQAARDAEKARRAAAGCTCKSRHGRGCPLFGGAGVPEVGDIEGGPPAPPVTLGDAAQPASE